MIRATAKVNPEIVERVKKRIEERAGKAHAHRVSVGIHEADGAKHKLDYNHEETAISLVEVAAAHEFGKGNLIERSWLRSWFDRNRSRLIHEMNDAMRAEYHGDSEAIPKAGERWANELREWIEMEDGHLNRLSPTTVAKKERAGLDRPATPLYATGDLVAAIKAMMDGATL